MKITKIVTKVEEVEIDAQFPFYCKEKYGTRIYRADEKEIVEANDNIVVRWENGGFSYNKYLPEILALAQITEEEFETKLNQVLNSFRILVPGDLPY